MGVDDKPEPGAEEPVADQADEAQAAEAQAAEAQADDDQADDDQADEGNDQPQAKPEKAKAPPPISPRHLEAIPGHVNPEAVTAPVMDLERLQALEAAKPKDRPEWLRASGGVRAVRRAIQEIPRVVCPNCGAKLPDIRCERGGDLRYYRCKVCVDPATGFYTRFRVRVVDPSPS